MVYETFQKTLIAQLQKRMGPECSVSVHQIPKNNGLLRDALALTLRGQPAAPLVYVNDYYQRFLAQEPLNRLTEEIAEIYREYSGTPPFDLSILTNFDELKDKVVFKLIHTASNQELLADLPHIPFFDLSLIFYLFLKKTEYGQMTALIHTSSMKSWNTTQEELFRLAGKNTPRLLPSDLRSMEQVMHDLIRPAAESSRDFLDDIFHLPGLSPLYVLTNTSGIHGACACLYPGILKNFADLLDRDLIILPSSVHEVLLVPYEDSISLEEMEDIVSHINRTEVPAEDRLSDTVYFYSRKFDRILPARDLAPSPLS